MKTVVGSLFTASRMRVAVVLLAVCAAMSLATPAHAQTPLPVVQTFADSTAVHSPSFISPSRGWALVGQRLLQSNDGGTRWSLSVPDEWKTFAPRSLAFADPTHGWVVADRGIVMATTDSGAHWTIQAAGHFPNTEWTAVWAVDASHVFAASASGIVAGTDDGGATWTQRFAEQGAKLRELTFADKLHGWAVGEHADGHGLILATGDGGATWAPHEAPGAPALSAVAFADPSHGWVAGSSAMLRTSDGGATWVAVAAPSEWLGSGRVHLAFASSTHGFLGRERAGNSAPGLWETSDAGVSWTSCAIAEESAGVNGLATLDPTHLLATGLSKAAADSLTTARIWLWSAAGSSAQPAQTAAGQLGSSQRSTLTKAQAAAKAKAAKAKAARLKAARLKAAKVRAARAKALKARKR